MIPRRVPILGEGERWIVLEKPSGIAVHYSSLVAHDRRFFVSRVRAQLGAKVHPAHRLDRATSGCLLFGRSPSETGPLQAALASGKKRYIALVRGWFKSEEPVTLDRPIRTESGPKAAQTTFHLLARTRTPRLSVILCEPATGRRHQIRRHLAHLAHPILRDSAHGDSKINGWWRRHWGLQRLALHLHELDLELDGEPIRTFSPLPIQLRSILVGTGLWDDAVQRRPSLELPPLQIPPRRRQARRDNGPP